MLRLDELSGGCLFFIFYLVDAVIYHYFTSWHVAVHETVQHSCSFTVYYLENPDLINNLWNCKKEWGKNGLKGGVNISSDLSSDSYNLVLQL